MCNGKWTGNPCDECLGIANEDALWCFTHECFVEECDEDDESCNTEDDYEF
jgi:hypothetical protein